MEHYVKTTQRIASGSLKIEIVTGYDCIYENCQLAIDSKITLFIDSYDRKIHLA